MLVAVRRSSAASVRSRPAVDGSAGQAPRRRPAPARTPRWRRTTSAAAACAGRRTRTAEGGGGRRRGRRCPAAAGRAGRSPPCPTPWVVLGQVPRPPERADRSVDVAAVEPQLGVDRQARLRLFAASELTGDHRVPRARGARAGSVAITSRACSRSSQAWQSLRLSRGSASHAASSRSTLSSSPTSCASRARAACTGRRS